MGKANFTDEFKLDPIQQITERGYSVADVSRRLGVSTHSLYSWMKHYSAPEKAAAKFRVIVTHRPKFACRDCTDGVVQAPAPVRLIPAGLPTEAMIAHVLSFKDANHLLLYRQAQIMAHQGVDIDCSTLAD